MPTSSLTVQLLEVANEYEARQEQVIQQYKEEINQLQLENIRLKNELDSQQYRIDDLVEHSQRLATNLAKQSSLENLHLNSVVQELVATQFQLRDFHESQKKDKQRARRKSRRVLPESGEENDNPNNNETIKSNTGNTNKPAAISVPSSKNELVSPYPSKSELFEAAAEGDKALLKSLLQPKIILTKTALESSGNEDDSQNATTSKKKNNVSETTFFTDLLGCALVRACSRKQLNTAKMLVELGANVRQVDPEDPTKQSSLHKAAASGSADILKMLLSKYPDGLDELDQVS